MSQARGPGAAVLEQGAKVGHGLGLGHDGWVHYLKRVGQPRFRADQIMHWLQGEASEKHEVVDPEVMVNLPQALRASLARDFDWSPVFVDQKVFVSDDGTRKLLLVSADGARLETVLLPREEGAVAAAEPFPEALQDHEIDHATQDMRRSKHGHAQGAFGRGVRSRPVDAHRSEQEPDGEGSEWVPVTQCLSSQIGCAMGCVFCASGLAGLKRHLRVEEILAQVHQAKKYLHPQERLQSLVFMGMGEPLHNYEALVQALRILMAPPSKGRASPKRGRVEGVAGPGGGASSGIGLGFSPRRITVSTSGIVPAIDALGRDFAGEVGLAISLHGTTDAQRSRLVPVGKKYPLDMLMDALLRYPLARRGRITVEYTLIEGYNDSLDDAQRLVKLLRPLRCLVNLIPMNPVAHGDAQQYRAPSAAATKRFQQTLQRAHVPVFLRKQRGDDVDAACGQLALKGADGLVQVRAKRALPSLD